MRRAFAAALIAAACASLLPAGRAGAGTTFTFHGSGWGHGIGMSQYGALGLAQAGWTAGQIVRHYYRGARVARRDPPARRFRIGLLQGRSELTLRAEQGSFRLVAGGETLDRVGEGGTRRILVRTTSTGRDVFKVFDGSGDLVVRGGSREHPLEVRRARGSLVRVVDGGWPHRAGRGSLEFRIVGTRRAHLVAVLSPQAYLMGIAEVPSSWPAPALGAQAIAARTYAFEKVARLGQMRAGCACGLYASTLDQFYIGWDKEAGPSGERWRRAVADTEDLVALYDGAYIATFYSSSSGGHTENIEVVWPAAAPQPYLRGVCDPAEDETGNPNEFWRTSLSDAAVTARLRPYTGDLGTVRAFRDFVRGVSGRVSSVVVVGSRGQRRVEGWDVRTALGLKDTRFWVNADFNVYGRIRDGYDALMCRPGAPRSRQRSIEGGRVQAFARGRMYFNRPRDAVTWLRGPVLDAYLGQGAHRGSLGLPYRLRRLDDGGWRGLFDGGTVVCRPGEACRISLA